MWAIQARAAIHHRGFVTLSRNRTSAVRSSAEPIFCSGILVPGV
jgi:hypothetical protein